MVQLFLTGFVEVKRWQDFRKPKSQGEGRGGRAHCAAAAEALPQRGSMRPGRRVRAGCSKCRARASAAALVGA
jgi:hypothetical protein